MEKIIILEDHFIDVTKIHFIEPIVNHYMNLYGKENKKYNEIPKGYSFKISFFGKDSITIEKSCHKEFNPEKNGVIDEKYYATTWWYELPDAENKSYFLLKRVETARLALVKFWNEAKVDIPTIKI